MKYDLSLLIPARSEQFISNTVEDILKNKRGKTEILVGLDGEWAEIEDHPDVRIIYVSESIGQRAMQNKLAKLSTAKYVAKVDAHCAFSEGFDVELMKTFDELGENIVVAPLMKNLWAYDWKCMKCGSRWYQGPTPVKCMKRGKNTSEVLEHPECDGTKFTQRIVFKPRPDTPNSCSYRFDKDLHFQYHNEYKKKQTGDLVESMSLQGSFFLCTRVKYFELPLCDETWGSWGQQGSEAAIKTRTSGGKVIINKRCWYAHLFRTQPGFSFPYQQSGRAQQKARDICNDIFKNSKWEKQVYPLSKILDDFWLIPGWSDEDLLEQKKRECQSERSGIYRITSSATSKVYIGSAENIAGRIYEHTRKLKQGKHHNIHLQRSYDKYGKEDLIFQVLRFCPKEDLIKYEQNYIDDFKSKVGWKQMFNMSPTAGNTLGKPCSVETKAKISQTKIGRTAWNKGLTLEDPRVRKYADKIRGKPKWINKPHPRGMLGKSHTEEAKNRITLIAKSIAVGRMRGADGKFYAK